MAFQNFPDKIKWFVVFILSIKLCFVVWRYSAAKSLQGLILSSVRPEALLASSLNTFISCFSCYLLSVFPCHFVMILQSRLMFCKTDLLYEEARLRYAICSICYQLSISFELPVLPLFFPFHFFSGFSSFILIWFLSNFQSLKFHGPILHVNQFHYHYHYYSYYYFGIGNQILYMQDKHYTI